MRVVKLSVPAALFVAFATVAVATAQEHPKGEHPAKEHPGAAEHPAGAEHLQKAAPAAAVTGHGVLAVAAADGRFTQFLAAVKAAGLQEKLQGPGPFTIFAPTDEAFAKLPPAMLENLLKPANQARLAGLLGEHVVPGQLAAARFKTMKAANVNGRDLAISVTDGKATVEGAGVVGAELTADNGVIHAVDAVLLPKLGNEHPENSKPKDHPGH